MRLGRLRKGSIPLHVGELWQRPCAVAHVVVMADDDEVDWRQVRVLHRQRRGDDALRPDALQPADADNEGFSIRGTGCEAQTRQEGA